MRLIQAANIAVETRQQGMREFDLFLPADHRRHEFGDVAGICILSNAVCGLFAQGHGFEDGLFIGGRGLEQQGMVVVHGTPWEMKDGMEPMTPCRLCEYGLLVMPLPFRAERWRWLRPPGRDPYCPPPSSA